MGQNSSKSYKHSDTPKDSALSSSSKKSFTNSNNNSFKINENYYPTASAYMLPPGFEELAADINTRYPAP